jgi:hypothetical protein
LRNEPDNKVWGSYTVYCQPGLFLFWRRVALCLQPNKECQGRNQR